MPRVSVVMPMYNGLPYVGEAIESIINQTFQDWELLVIDDASTDGSPDVVRQYVAKDARVKLIRNDSDLHGAGPARNIGIYTAVGEYVAMMDSDDISLPNRLQEQVKFMDRHSTIAFSGCWVKCFEGTNRIIWSIPNNFFIKALLLFCTESFGPTIIFRRSDINERYQQLPICEDTLFCINISLKHSVANIPKILYLYRVRPHSVTRTVNNYPYRKQVWEKLFPLRFGFTPTSEQIDAHMAWLGYIKRPLATQMRWIFYVLIYGKYSLGERVILIIWCAGYSIKAILRSLFKKHYMGE